MGKTIHPFGKEIISVSTEFCGRTLTIEYGRLAFQAGASVLVTYGETVIQGIANVAKNAVGGYDYFPLSIDYEEKMYAAGKISGSRFVKREGKPSDEAILIGRLIDRPIRPLWPKGYRNEAQGIATVLSLDPSFRPDAVAMIAVSTAFMLTGAPYAGPVAGVRLALVDGKFIAYPTREEMEKSTLDLMVAGTKDAIMMVEAGAEEVDEKTMAEALKAAHAAIQPAISLQAELVKKVGVEAQEFELLLPDEAIYESVTKWLDGKLGEKVRGPSHERNEKLKALKDEMFEHFTLQLAEGEELSHFDYAESFELVVKKDVRKGILEEGIRPDGRNKDEIRTLSSEVGILPRAHGSAIFTRGLTQALNITTLAPLSYAQLIDTMEEDTEKRFIHHYNAPGYSTGEIRRLGSPGRREIGHGALAERSLAAVIPSVEEFPYTIRTVSEIMSQNGSTSMASVCSGCLSLMDAGVPLKAPVSGIAMGLVTDGKGKYVVLSDIQGAEDFAGDMDFKVAGTENGITGLQMDIKIAGITPEIMAEALLQAKTGRAHILKHMLETLAGPREELSQYAPRVESITIHPDKIREVIGKGGEMIQKITAETGTEIDIKDDGVVMIASPDKAKIEAAKKWIHGIVAEPEIGTIYENCRVVSVLDFGAFVEILPGKEGLVHVSEMKNERVNHPKDVVSEGDLVTVKLLAIDDRGRLVLSMKAVEKK